jgi:sugar lactone lactonase YvrE
LTAEVLATGLGLAESPRWHDGRLWFSDWVAQTVIALDLGGHSEVITEVRTLPFSIDWLPAGPLLVTSGRAVLRLEEDGSLVTHADLSGITAHGLNEIVVSGRGSVYVNAVGFDMAAGADFAPGMVAVIAPDGSTRRVADGIAFPNGMALTPDSSTLIVADSYGRQLTAFDIGADDTLSGRRVWADLGDGIPDGVCLDADGAVWYADVPNQRCVRVAEGGEVLEQVDVDRGCFACMLGGADGSTLFILAQDWNGPEAIGRGPRTGQVLAVEAPAPHAGRP